MVMSKSRFVLLEGGYSGAAQSALRWRDKSCEERGEGKREEPRGQMSCAPRVFLPAVSSANKTHDSARNTRLPLANIAARAVLFGE